MDNQTLKQTPMSELSFIGQVVKKGLEIEGATWDMTTTGAATLGLASKGNIGQALYMLDKIDPQPDSLVTDSDVAAKFPLGFEGDWTKEWDRFKQSDQRRVFKR